MNHELCVVQRHATLLDVLKKVEASALRFVLVADESKQLSGIMTEGDIRRLIIKKCDVGIQIDGYYNSDFIAVDVRDGFEKVSAIFQNNKIIVIPVLDNGVLVNVITKEYFQSIVLEDKEFELSSLREPLVQTQSDIKTKPWGFYKSTFISQYSQSKLLFVYPQQELSLQKHKFREEHWVVTKGECEVTIGDTVTAASAGMYFFIPKDVKHRIRNISSDNNLIVTEVQLGTYFGEDDIVRFDDIYGRS